MPRRVIPIRTGPAQFDFQDSAGGLTDGLAQAIAVLAALPGQNRQIEQEYQLRTADSDRQNRRDAEANAFRREEFDRRGEQDTIANGLRQNAADLQLAQAGGYAGPRRDLGQISARVGAQDEARVDMQQQVQAAKLAHAVEANDRRWGSEDLSRIMGVERPQGTGVPYNPDLLRSGRNGGVVVMQPKNPPSERGGWQYVKGEDGTNYRFNRESGAMEEIAAPAATGGAAPGATPEAPPVQFPTPEAPSSSAWSLRPSGAAGGPQTLGDVLGGRWMGDGDQPPAETAPQSDPQQAAAGSLRSVSEAAGKANITPDQRRKFMATQADLHQRYLAAAASQNQQEMQRINDAIVKHAQLVTGTP